MNFTTHGTGKRRERRLITTLAALFLPMLALAFLSGSFFKTGTLQPGEVVQAAGMQHMVMAPARESETETGTPGSTTTAQTTGTAVSTGTPQTTSTAQATGTSQATGTAATTGTAVTTGTPAPVCTPSAWAAVSVTESGFSPSNITVSAGTQVTWTNNGTGRHRIRDIGHVLFDSDDIYPGQTFSYTFCNGGTYYYEDSRSSATGVVVVSGGQTTATPGGTGTAETTGTAVSTGTPQATGTPGGTGTIFDVQMQSHDVFAPNDITIHTGDTVRWTNADDEAHTTTSDTGVWNSGPLNAGQQFTFTFLNPGTYTYACLIHSEMRGTVRVTGAAITPTPGGSATATPTAASGTVTVNIQNFAFQPQNLNIAIGTTVHWVNLDTASHTSNCDTNVWNSGTLSQGGTYDYTFNTAGVYTYHCAIHPGMTGSITVGNVSSTATVQATGTAQTTSTVQPSETAETTRSTTPTAQTTGTAQTTQTPQATNTPGVVQVNISNYSYNPSTITVQAGTTVRWLNNDPDRHSVTSQAVPPLFDSGEFTQGASWSYTFNTPGSYSYYCTVHGTFMTGTIIVQAQATATASPAPGQIFSDVTPNDYFYTAVNWLAGRGVISGYSDGSFRPFNNTTRGQLSKIVVLGEGWAINTTGAPHFADVPNTNAFYSYVETAYNHGVISGYADGTFRSGNNVTRGQLSKIVVTARGWTTDTTGGPHFTDVPANDPFYSYIETAANHAIISGYADGTFRSGNNATRGQISKIVYNALNGQ